MQTVRSFDRLSFIHSSIPLSMTPALSSADTEKIFQKRSKEELVSFFCFGPRSMTHTVWEKWNQKGIWVYRLKALPDLLAPGIVKNKKRSQRQKTKRKEIKESVITRTVIQLCIKSRTREEIWTVSSFLSFVAQESHRQSRWSQSQWWQDTKRPAAFYTVVTHRKRENRLLFLSESLLLLDLVMWGYSTSFLQTDGSGGGVCGGGGITGFESTLQKLRGCITLSADADEGAPDWLIECATASSKGVVSTLHQCTTTASQLLERRRNCIYTHRERAIGFHLIYDPPVYFSSRWWCCWYIYFLLRWGAFCVRKKKGSRVCVWALRWVKGKWRHFHNDSHLLGILLSIVFEPGLFSSQKWKFHPGFSILFDA